MAAAASGGPLWLRSSWIARQQSIFYRDLTADTRQPLAKRSAVSLLITLSFAYGVFHAIGPGHGKAVIASYLLATGDRRSAASSSRSPPRCVQALTAILVVAVGTLILNVTAMTMTRATDGSRSAATPLIARCGVWLLWMKFSGRGGHADRAAASVEHDPATCNHPHHRLGRHFACRAGRTRPCLASAGFTATALAGNGQAQSVAGLACDCGHSHAPDPAKLDRPLTLTRAWTAILAVGIRPCSGAIIVLVFAVSQRLDLGRHPVGARDGARHRTDGRGAGDAGGLGRGLALRFSGRDPVPPMASSDRRIGERASLILGLVMLGGALARASPPITPPLPAAGAGRQARPDRLAEGGEQTARGLVALTQYSGCHWTPTAKPGASTTRTASIVPSGAIASTASPSASRPIAWRCSEFTAMLGPGRSRQARRRAR